MSKKRQAETQAALASVDTGASILDHAMASLGAPITAAVAANLVRKMIERIEQ